MTLCTAYIRQANETEELIFATDSELTGGGEKWDKGIKLFELPNKDALLCFTGTTARAYPLILNLISSISYEDIFFKKAYTLSELQEHIADLFSGLVKTITDFVEDKHKVRGEARFLLGGWDWESNQFRIWLLLYNPDIERFEANELTEDKERNSFYIFIGEAKDIDAEDWANQNFTQLLIDEDKLHKKLDMEPLQILRKAAIDNEIKGIGGSLQIAKVHKSNRTEFFGIYWHSSEGRPCFQGREYNEMNKPLVRYFDPDTFEIIDSEIPTRLNELDSMKFGNDLSFVESCYEAEPLDDKDEGEENMIYHLKSDLSERDRIRLRTVFKEVTYRFYVEHEEKRIMEKQGL